MEQSLLKQIEQKQQYLGRKLTKEEVMNMINKQSMNDFELNVTKGLYEKLFNTEMPKELINAYTNSSSFRNKFVESLKILVDEKQNMSTENGLFTEIDNYMESVTYPRKYIENLISSPSSKKIDISSTPTELGVRDYLTTFYRIKPISHQIRLNNIFENSVHLVSSINNKNIISAIAKRRLDFNKCSNEAEEIRMKDSGIYLQAILDRLQFKYKKLFSICSDCNGVGCVNCNNLGVMLEHVDNDCILLNGRLQHCHRCGSTNLEIDSENKIVWCVNCDEQTLEDRPSENEIVDIIYKD